MHVQEKTREHRVVERSFAERSVVFWAAAAFVVGCVPVVIGSVVGDGAWGREVLTASVMVAVLGAVTVGVFAKVVRPRLGRDVEVSRRSRTGLVLAVLALVTVAAFWSGLPVVLGAAGVLLGVDALADRRSGTAIAAVVVGGLAIVAGLGAARGTTQTSPARPRQLRSSSRPGSTATRAPSTWWARR